MHEPIFNCTVEGWGNKHGKFDEGTIVFSADRLEAYPAV
jgi:hypothetical protein